LQIWYAIPSANPPRAEACLAKWKAQGYLTAVLLDEGSPPVAGTDLTVYVGSYRGYYVSARQLCDAIGSSAEIVVTGGDDMDPDPRHTAEEIGREFVGRFPDGFGVMQPIGDDLDGTDRICGSPWFGRGWIDRSYGGKGPFCQEYTQFYGDEELLQVTRKLGVLWQQKALVQRHDHWIRPGGPEKTDYQRRNESRWWAVDAAVHGRRQAAGWPGHEPL
jgi:hypothetical protein